MLCYGRKGCLDITSNFIKNNLDIKHNHYLLRALCSISNQFTLQQSIIAQGFSADYVNYLKSLLQACHEVKCLTNGKKIHQLLIKSNTHIELRSQLLEKLTHLYLKCNKVKLARNVFDEIPNPSVILWNLMIKAYAWNGPFGESVALYYEMLDAGISPTKFTFPFVLKACSGLQDIEVGRQILEHATKCGLDSDVYVCTALIDMYSKCGDLSEAQRVFHNMLYRDIVAWNAMIAGFSLHGFFDDTVQLFIQMQKAGRSPNSSTVVAFLPTVGEANALNLGKAIHCYSLRRSFSDDVVLGTGLLDMYAKCKCISYARRIFDKIKFKNEVCWSAMIGAHVTCDFMREALALFDDMVLKNAVCITPVTLGSILRASAKLNDPSRGKKVHCCAIKYGFDFDIMVGNTLLSMYSKCGIIDDAVKFFNKMVLKDAVSYGAIISGCVQNGYAEAALYIFHEMQLSGTEPELSTLISLLSTCAHLAALQHGACIHGYSIVHGFVTDTSICNAMMDMYSKCGKISIARQVFNRMQTKDIFSWNTMIVGYGIHGHGSAALSLFHDMLTAGVKPDDVTFIGLLFACSHSGLVTEGKHWFRTMSQDFNIIPRMEHYICMTDLLGRAGLLNEAYTFIQRMPFEADVRVYGSLLAACRIHNNVKLGEVLSKKIHGIGPEGTGNFVLLSNLYSAVGKWDDAAHVRIAQRDQGFKKSPGCSW